jgi:hypothetical protein
MEFQCVSHIALAHSFTGSGGPMRYALPAVALLLLSLPACENQPVEPDSRTPSFGKAPAKDVWSRAVLVWDDSVTINGVAVAAGIRGDGRNRFGQAAAPVNEYQGDFCGVRGFIYDQSGESGNLEFDSDTYYLASMAPACGASRSLSFYLAGQSAAPIIASPHVLGTAIWPLLNGESRLVAQRFGMQNTTSCGELDFNSVYSGSNNVRLTRLSDGTDAGGLAVRRWRIESQGNHTAACVKMQANGKFADSGLRYYLPFGVTITQVRNPSPTFP